MTCVDDCTGKHADAEPCTPALDQCIYRSDPCHAPQQCIDTCLDPGGGRW